MSGPWVRALAPAKVNLTLEVLGQRADGYHEIRSWMLAVDLVDVVRVRVEREGGVRLVLSGAAASADVPLDARNLAVRAAAAALELARARGLAGAGAGLGLELEKSIPSQAGLGGGSSDAAAAWIAACTALGVEASEDEARATLARLGSDCVFFQKARRGIGIASGRGEVVEIVTSPPPAWTIALVTPVGGASTAAVYARALPRRVARPSLPLDLTKSARDAAAHDLENDLESAAIAALPELAAWRALLDGAGLATWRLAGSGSSWFGLYDDAHDARTDLERVVDLARRRGLDVRVARAVRPAGHGAMLARES